MDAGQHSQSLSSLYLTLTIEDHLYNVEEADIVPSGVAELSHLQAQGYTYLRP